MALGLRYCRCHNKHGVRGQR